MVLAYHLGKVVDSSANFGTNSTARTAFIVAFVNLDVGSIVDRDHHSTLR